MTDDVAKFSEIGDRYGEQLARGLSATGESAEYFATARVARVAQLAHEGNAEVRAVLDFGCGTGSTFAMLRRHFPHARIVGFEPAQGLRALAQRAAAAVGAEVVDADTLQLDREIDVVYCNGVFHHTDEAGRAVAVASIHRAMNPGGRFFVWENSPFNPGTRWVMSRIPFDRDARLLTPAAMRALLAASGLAPVRTEFHFVFPRALQFLRSLEPLLRGAPLGGQYLVVGTRRDVR